MAAVSGAGQNKMAAVCSKLLREAAFKAFEAEFTRNG